MRVTGQQMKIPAIYVEKDYWVTYFKNLVYGELPPEKGVFESLQMNSRKTQKNYLGYLKELSIIYAPGSLEIKP